MHPTRIFKEPNEIKKVFEDYKKDLERQSNEWVKIDYVGKDGMRVEEPQKVPMTFEGFKRYCREYHGEIEQYFTNQDGYYNDFIGICRAIKEEIRENQIIGGLLNFYNPSITQRLNNLVERQQIEVTEHEIFKGIDLDAEKDNSTK
jgi:uncharacterized short protein YbdD (DUF466 family)